HGPWFRSSVRQSTLCPSALHRGCASLCTPRSSRRCEITMPIADERKLLASPTPALYRVHHGVAKGVQASKLVRESLLVLSKVGRETRQKKHPVLIDDFGEVDKICVRKRIV